MASLRAGASTWIAAEFSADGFASLEHWAGYAPLAKVCDECGSEVEREAHDASCSAAATDPTDQEIWDDLSSRYGGGWDDSTDLRSRGE
jgi:hypothetical protein